MSDLKDLMLRSELSTEPAVLQFREVNSGHLAGQSSIVSAQLVGGQVEVIRFRRSNFLLASCPPQEAAGEVTKDIYGIGADGQIQLLRTVIGRHIPAQHLAERFEFPSETEVSHDPTMG